MLRVFSLSATVFLCSASVCFAQSAPPAQSSASASSTAPQAKPVPPSPKDTNKKKPKKVWTNDDVSSIGGDISVVGDSNASSAPDSSAKPDEDSSATPARERKISSYRNQLRQLQMQLDVTAKKLSGLQNFNGNSSSGSGGINTHQRYSMTPVAEQIKQLETKKKQLEEHIDSILDAARKDGIEPGELR